MGVEQAYIDLLDSNLELRIKLTKEETITIRNKEKIRKLTNDLERCELYIKYLEKNLISREDEIDRLKAEYYSTLYNLKKCQDHLELKEEALIAQDNRIIQLEDTVEKLKSQILKISHFQNNSNKPSEEEEQENMALPDILRNIGTALDRVENYIDGVDTTFNPKNTLNGIRILLTTVCGHMQRHAQDAINLQGQLNTAHNLLNNANGQINNFFNDMANVRNECLRRAQLLTIAYNNEANERRLREKAVLQILARRRKAEADLAEFNRAWVFNRYQKWKARELNSRQIILNLQNNPPGNMAGIQDVMNAMAPLLAREEPYVGQEAPDDYFNRISQILAYGDTLAVVGFNNAIKTNVLASKMAGRFVPPNPFNNNAGGAALNHEKFNITDSPETYEKRIKLYAQGIVFADALPYLYDHLPNKLSEESEKPPIQQIPPSSQTLAIQPQKDDFKIRLARDLSYSGIVTDNATLENFIYEELQKRLGSKTAHVRKNLFIPRSAYATKKVVRKVVLKASAKQTRHCLACGKVGHIKVNCPKGKQTKKVNHVYHDEVEEPEDLEEEYIEEYIVEEEEDPEEEEEDVEYVDDGESILSTSDRNCYASRASNLAMAIDLMYQIALKSFISSLVPHCLKEILIEISKFINTIFPKLKDHCLNTVMPNDTVKRRELAWENVTSKVQDILFPLLQAVNTKQKSLLDVLSEENVKSSIDTMNGIIVNNSENHQETAPSHILNHAIKAYTQYRSAEKKSDIVHIYWPKPLEINFLQIKDADDVATISCKVGGMTIPYAMIDNRKKVHRLNGVASKSHSLGTVDSVPVTIDDEENRDTIPDEFSVVPTEYDDNGKELSLFILGTQWQYRAGWEPLVKEEFRVVPEISQQCSLVQEISPQSSVVPEISQQYLEKNMVPIRLSLA
ncbi:hypothetical protein RhiirA4_457494 [Rhizophagus irregularis]|uniref:CCHC-type domain-containing protein n=1 Tax=Rhizophagus irregularis TaxID=588596 RepID=A0A2I1GA59_9GLOM|nr:hypothetical protein RhiirA4_457494 [Rhizophagus irregularis]